MLYGTASRCVGFQTRCFPRTGPRVTSGPRQRTLPTSLAKPARERRRSSKISPSRLTNSQPHQHSRCWFFYSWPPIASRPHAWHGGRIAMWHEVPPKLAPPINNRQAPLLGSGVTLSYIKILEQVRYNLRVNLKPNYCLCLNYRMFLQKPKSNH